MIKNSWLLFADPRLYSDIKINSWQGIIPVVRFEVINLVAGQAMLSNSKFNLPLCLLSVLCTFA